MLNDYWKINKLQVFFAKSSWWVIILVSGFDVRFLESFLIKFLKMQFVLKS
jgi:hypothetical protein